MNLEPIQFVWAVIGALLIGATKTGIMGLGVLFVGIFASIIPAKESVGVVLPMLIFADIWGVAYHHKNAQWRIILKLLPWVLPGIALGALALQMIPSENMAPIIGVLLLALIAMQVAQQLGAKWITENVPHQVWFSAVAGLLVGFLTMAGNVAGSVMGIYLLSMGLEKKKFMGTCAWYFLIVNVIKVPIHLGLGYITGRTLLFDLKMAPVILLGVGSGILIFRRIPEKWFTRSILALATIAALRLVCT